MVAAIYLVGLVVCPALAQDCRRETTVELRCDVRDGGTVKGSRFYTVTATFCRHHAFPAEAEDVLRQCMMAARTMHPASDLVGSAWYDEDQLPLRDGAEMLSYRSDSKQWEAK